MEGTFKAALDVTCKSGLAAKTFKDALVAKKIKVALGEKIFKDGLGAKITKVALDERKTCKGVLVAISKDVLAVTPCKVDLDAKKTKVALDERMICKDVLDAISKDALEGKRTYKAGLDARRCKDALAVTRLKRMRNRDALDGKTMVISSKDLRDHWTKKKPKRIPRRTNARWPEV